MLTGKLNFYGRDVGVRRMLHLNWLQVVVAMDLEESRGKGKEKVDRVVDEGFMMLEKRMRGLVELCCMRLLGDNYRLVKVLQLNLLVVGVGLGERGREELLLREEV